MSFMIFRYNVIVDSFLYGITIMIAILLGPVLKAVHSRRIVFKKQIFCCDRHENTIAVILDYALSFNGEKRIAIAAIGGIVQ